MTSATRYGQVAATGGWQVPLRHAKGARQLSRGVVAQGSPLFRSASQTVGVALLQKATADAQRRVSVTPPSVTVPHCAPTRANGAGRQVELALPVVTG